MTKKRAIVATLFLLTAAAGCRQDEGASAAPQSTAAAPSAEAEAALPSGDSLTERSTVPAQRKLIQTAELHLEVPSYLRAREAIDAQLARVGGYVADARVEHRDGEVSRAELTIRVPVGELAAFLSSTARSGEVLHETLSSEDITEDYYDLKARLENARRLEGRLLSLMSSQADSVKALLEVERELARVREEIERFEGKMRLWDGQVALSTVKLQLFTEQLYAAAAPPSLSQRLGDTLGESWKVMVGLGRGILLLAAALLPWLLPLSLLVWALLRLQKRIERRYRERAVATGMVAAPAPAPLPAHASLPPEDDEDAPHTLPSGGSVPEPQVGSAA